MNSWVRLVPRRRVGKKGETYFTWNPKFTNCTVTVDIDLLRQIGVDDGDKVDFSIDLKGHAIAITKGVTCLVSVKPGTSRVKLTSRTLYKALPFAYDSGEAESSEVKELDDMRMIIVRLKESDVKNKAYDTRVHRSAADEEEEEVDEEEDEEEENVRSTATSRKAAKKTATKKAA